MININNINIESCAFIVGFFGDIFLQLYCKNSDRCGLNSYFTQHGSAEAPFIAGGMGVLFFIIYNLFGLPLKWQYIAIYGVLLDIIFRKFMIFPSLKDYYISNTFFWTCLYEAIAMVLPLILYSVLKKQ